MALTAELKLKPPRPSVGLRWLRKVNVVGLLTGVGLLGLWELLVETKILDYPSAISSPSQIIGAVGQLVTQSGYPENLGHTVEVVVAGWAIAGVAGVVLGLALGLSRRAWVWSMASLDILRSLPAIAFVPIMVIIFGLSSHMEFTLVLVGGFWPVVLNTISGVRAVHPLLGDVAKTLRLSRLGSIRKIVLPAAAAQIIVGLRLSLALSLVLAVVAEMIGNPHGLGYQLVFYQQAFKPQLMWGYLLTIGILGILLNGIFVGLVRLLAPGIMLTRRDAR